LFSAGPAGSARVRTDPPIDPNKGKKILWKWGIPCWLAVILVSTLWPFNFWARNKAALGPQDGLRLIPPSTVYSAAPPLKLSRIGKFTILLDLTPDSSDGNGYARIVAYSLDESRRNFLLAQWNDSLVFLMETAGGNRRVHFEVEGVLRKGERQSLALAYDGQALSLYRNGDLRSTRRTGPLDFSGWNSGYPLVIGSEGNGKYPWRGSIHCLAVFDRPMTGDEIRSLGERNHGARQAFDPPLIRYEFGNGRGTVIKDLGKGAPADLLIPEHFAPYARSILGKPPAGLGDLWADKKDKILNVLLFLPLGFLLARHLRSRGFSLPRAVLLTTALGFGLSLTVELLQAFLPSRESDLMDLISNTLGTLAGSFINKIDRGTRRRTMVN